jgi:hypothetical protein
MKKARSFRSAGVCLLAIIFFLTLPAFAAGEVKLVGKLCDGGKRIVDGAGKTYTIIPAEDIGGELGPLDGQRVELSGVVYVSHGKNMITALSIEKLE